MIVSKQIEKSIKASDLFRFEIKPFLFGALLSRTLMVENNEYFYFYGYTSKKVSKALTQYDFSQLANELVNSYDKASGYENWTIHSANAKETSKAQEPAFELRFYIKNDLNLDIATFNNSLYKSLMQCNWLYDSELTEKKKNFIRGFMETRGSIDTTIPFISQDYFYKNKLELKRVQVLIDMMDLPMAYANFNPRHMQPQYVSGESKRNAQFRINLFWYANEIGFINKYMADTFESAYRSKIPNHDVISKDGIIYFGVAIPVIKSMGAFINYLNFFTNNIYNKELSEANIQSLRQQIGFADKQNSTIKSNRNSTIKEIFENISPDECALCGTKKTFTKPNGRQGFEIHHMIPFYNGREYDNIANFVKLCSTCHDSLKKGRATKDEQIKNIITILSKNEPLLDYAKAILEIEKDNITINDVAEEIYTMLG